MNNTARLHPFLQEVGRESNIQVCLALLYLNNFFCLSSFNYQSMYWTKKVLIGIIVPKTD